MYVYIKPDGTVKLSKYPNRDLLIESHLAFKTSITDEGIDVINFENIKNKHSVIIKQFSIPVIDLV